MATSKSRKLNILCIMSKIRAFFVDLRSVMSYSHVCGKHLHEGTIAIRRGVSDYTTGLTSPFFHMPVPNQESEQSCICLLRV